MIIFDGVIYSWHGHGGIAVYFEEIISRLSELGHRGEVYRFIKSPIPLKSNYIQPRVLERYRAFDVDIRSGVFHSTYYRLPAKKGLKVVTTVHDFTYEKYVGGARGCVHSFQKMKAIRGSDYVICVSKNTMNDLFHYLPEYPREKVFVVHNGVSEKYVPLAKSDQLNGDRPYVIFVGMRSRYKNFNAAVEAVQRISYLELRCVGGGDFSKEELALLENKLKGRYRHMGRVSNDYLNRLYNNAFCLIYPSLYEGFGIPLVEAMRAGCPVLALNASATPEIVEDAGCLIEKPDPDCFYQGLIKMEDSAYRDDLIFRGLRRAKNFSWQKTAIETAEIYKLALR